MAFVTPYVTNKFIAYSGDQRRTILSLAIKLIDDFTKEEPIGNIKVSIQEGERKIDDKKIIKNLSGYYLLSDLATGDYTVSVESDYYFPEERVVNVPLPDTKNPIIEITLKPRPAYPFPDYANLVRGGVRDLALNKDPIIHAEVNVTEKSFATITDEKGEFVLYFKGIKKEGEPITVKIKKYAYTKNVDIFIKGEEKKLMGIIIFP